MKYRIRNRQTKNFVSKPTSLMEASTLHKRLNQTSSDPNLYELVSIEDEIKNIPDALRPMSEDEIEAIKHLNKIRYNPGAGHADFANSMLGKIEQKDFEISEKQTAYLWHILYHYRRQIDDRGLVALAERNKIY